VVAYIEAGIVDAIATRPEPALLTSCEYASRITASATPGTLPENARKKGTDLFRREK